MMFIILWIAVCSMYLYHVHLNIPHLLTRMGFSSLSCALMQHKSWPGFPIRACMCMILLTATVYCEMNPESGQNIQYHWVCVRSNWILSMYPRYHCCTKSLYAQFLSALYKEPITDDTCFYASLGFDSTLDLQQWVCLTVLCFFLLPQLWDIGGQPRFRSMWERYCRGVTAIV